MPTTLPPLPLIEPMQVVSVVIVKLPDVKVKLPNESFNVPVFPPKVTPPAPSKVKFAGYVKNVLLGKVIADEFLKRTVPRGACICPLVRDTAPEILNVPVDTLILPEVITMVPTSVIPDVRVKFPKVMVNDCNESVVGDPLLPPKVIPPAPFKIKLAGYLLKVPLGKVTALVLVNLTVPPGADIWPVCVIPSRDTVPPMLNIPVETLISPEVNDNEPTANVPVPKVTVPVFTWV